MVDWVAYVSVGSSFGLLVIAVVTAIFAYQRLRRETLDISVSVHFGGVSGPGYDELGFQVTLVNKGTRDVVIYSAGYHVKDDLDDRNFQFFDDHIYYRPAEKGDEGAVPKGESRTSDYESYRPDSTFQTIQSRIMFPIGIPPGGIYHGLWPVTIERHRRHLSALENHMYRDYFGLFPIKDNPIPYVFFSTVYGTQKMKVRPFGRCPVLVRRFRLILYRISEIMPITFLKELIFSDDYASGLGYWGSRRENARLLSDEVFFPPHSFDGGLHPMSIEENEERKRSRGTIRRPNFHQVCKHLASIAKGDGHIETASYSFDVSVTHSFHYGLLRATVERPGGYTSWNVHSFLELNMLLGLNESWAYSVVNTAYKQVPGSEEETYDTRYYFIPHERQLP